MLILMEYRNVVLKIFIKYFVQMCQDPEAEERL